MILEHFHFIRPYFLLLFVILFWLMWRVYKVTKKNNAWSDVCDPQLLSYLLVGTDKKTSRLPVFLLLLVGSLLILALSGPTWKKLPQAVYKKEAARVFVLDLSRSMDATDVTPSRASRAKLKLIDLLNASDEGQVALIVYAAEPHIVSPLTDDADTIVAMVPSLSTSIMPAQGSRTDRAIIKAAQLLTQAGSFEGEIVLIGDGSNGSKAMNAAEDISAAGYNLHVVGVGTEAGAPVPIRQGGFLKDNSGAIVIPKLDKSELKELALAGAGRYVDLAVDDSDVSRLIVDNFGTKASKDDGLAREADLWQDEGHWFLLLALPFAAMGFRRGWLTVMVFSVCYIPQGEVYAFEWQDLWQTKDQQAQKLMQAGEHEKAAKLYKNKNWQGAAHYKSGSFEQAAEAFSRSDAPDAAYNRGNALAKNGQLEDAIEAYDEILKNQPDHEDARFNRDLLKSILDQQKQQPSGDESDSDEQQSDENQQDSQQQDSKSSQSESESEQQQQSQSEQESEQQDTDTEQQQKAQESENREKQKEQEMEQQQMSQDEQEREEQQDQQKSEQEMQSQKEIEQATQQWLRRIPDDPGGLLREKFSRQYQRQRQRQQTENPW